MRHIERMCAFLILTVAANGPSVAAEDVLPESVTAYRLGSIAFVPREEATAPDEELQRLFRLYRDARAANMPDEADTLAKQIVSVAIESNGRESKNTAMALANLATLQTSNEDNTAAVLNFEAAIDILEQVESRLSADLIGPLTGMGAALMQADQPDRAHATWNRALHLSHVNYGPHNFAQIETLQSIGRMYVKAGMTKEAYKIRKRIYYLRMRDQESPYRIGDREEY